MLRDELLEPLRQHRALASQLLFILHHVNHFLDPVDPDGDRSLDLALELVPLQRVVDLEARNVPDLASVYVDREACFVRENTLVGKARQDQLRFLVQRA